MFRRDVPRAAVVVALLTCGASAAPPVVAEKPVHSPPVTTLRDVLLTFATRDKGPPPGSPERNLGEAIDAAEKFLRLTPEQMPSSDLLSQASREFPADSAGGRRLSRFVRLKRDHWYQQAVDGRLVGGRLAALNVVCVPKPANGPKATEILYLVRAAEGWRVSFDLGKDAESLGGDAPAAAETLRSLSEARQKEIASVVSEPLKEPIPFRGTWTTHYRTSFVYLTFDGQGEVFFLQDHPNGTASYGVYDYHLVGDEIVMETGSVAIRFRRHPDSGWEVDSRWYPELVADDARVWFPDYEGKEILLTPVRKREQPVRRPVPERTDATRPVPR
jgi:hypothetical protein